MHGKFFFRMCVISFCAYVKKRRHRDQQTKKKQFILPELKIVASYRNQRNGYTHSRTSESAAGRYLQIHISLFGSQACILPCPLTLCASCTMNSERENEKKNTVYWLTAAAAAATATIVTFFFEFGFFIWNAFCVMINDWYTYASLYVWVAVAVFSSPFSACSFSIHFGMLSKNKFDDAEATNTLASLHLAVITSGAPKIKRND